MVGIRRTGWGIIVLLCMFFSLYSQSKDEKPLGRFSFEFSSMLDTMSNYTNLVTLLEEEKGGDLSLWFNLGRRFSIGVGVGLRSKYWNAKEGYGVILHERVPLERYPLAGIPGLIYRESRLYARFFPVQLKAAYHFFDNYLFTHKIKAGVIWYLGRVRQEEVIGTNAPHPSITADPDYTIYQYFLRADNRAAIHKPGGFIGLSTEIKFVRNMALTIDFFYQMLDFGRIVGNTDYHEWKTEDGNIYEQNEGVWRNQTLWQARYEHEQIIAPGWDYSIDYVTALFSENEPPGYKDVKPFHLGLNNWVLRIGLRVKFFRRTGR